MTINATETTITATIGNDTWTCDIDTRELQKNGQVVEVKSVERLLFALTTNGMPRVFAAAFAGAVNAYC